MKGCLRPSLSCTYYRNSLSTESDDERSVPRLKTVTKIEILEGAGNGQRSLKLWMILISVPGEIQETEDDYHGDLNYKA